MSKDECNFDGTIYLASDHAGFALKEFIENKLSSCGYNAVDVGPHECDPDDDYPDIIRPAVKKVAEDVHSRGIIFGMSGQGEAMVANRIKGVRAALFVGGSDEIVRLAREHNDANVLSIGAHFVEPEEAWQTVRHFLGVCFPGDERHVRRIKKIDE